jgi:hypothetical protein
MFTLRRLRILRFIACRQGHLEIVFLSSGKIKMTTPASTLTSNVRFRVTH